MQLNPSEISELIKSRIQNLDAGVQMRTQGTVISVTDGICRIHGLSDVMQGEMLEFPKNTFGLALNLERDSVGSVILGEYEHITEGDPVKTTGKSAEYPKDAMQLKRGQRASVTCAFVVLESGDVTDVQIVESAGESVDNAVVSAYKSWKFTPGMKQGAKVKVRVTRRQTFLGG